MDGALLNPGIARRAPSWLEGPRLSVTPLRSGDLPAPGQYATPDAHVRATGDELAIQVDLPVEVARDVRKVRVAYDEAGVLHVRFFADGQQRYRRFDFGGVFEAAEARATISHGVLTIRVPRRRGERASLHGHS